MAASGSVIEYAGQTIRDLTMEERMTVCNMSIEGGARAGMIAPDDTTFNYLRGRRYAPADFERAVAGWKHLASDPGAAFDNTIHLEAAGLSPQVTWGTNPGQVTSIDSRVPNPAEFDDPNARKSAERALEYMGLKPGTPLVDIPVERVFHRILHQRPRGGPPVSGPLHQGEARLSRSSCHGGARLATGQMAGRKGRAAPIVSGVGVRLA